MQKRMIEQINVCVPDEVYHRVRGIAAEAGITPSMLVRRILAETLTPNAGGSVRMTTEAPSTYEFNNEN